MVELPWKIALCAALIVLWGANASAQSPVEGVEAIDWDEIERFVELAQAGTDPRVIASSREQFAESGPEYRNLPAILVSIEGEPAFVYAKERWGTRNDGFSEVIPFVMRCRGSGTVDLSFNFYYPRPHYEPEVEATFAELAGQIEEFGRSVPAVMRLRAYDSDATHDMPVAFAFGRKSHGARDSEGRVDIIHAQLVGTADSNDPFFRNLRATGNLSGQIIVDGQYTRLSSGVGLATFRSTAGPLLEHCRTGRANPMNRDLGPAPASSASTPEVQSPAHLDLAVLDQSRAAYIQRIYQGRMPSTDYPLHLRLTIPLAYHVAYSGTCGPQSEDAHDFVYTDIFGEGTSIAVPSEDFTSLLEAVSIYGAVNQKFYDDQVSNDYSFQEVLEIYRRGIMDWKGAWGAVLAHHGCSGQVIDRFRANVKAELPFVEYRRGSRNALVDFGTRQYEIRLPAPIDADTARRIGLAEAQSGNDGIFTESYPGKVLRAIAVGNFAQVEAANAELREFVSNPFGGDRDNPMSQIIRFAMQVESAFSRESGILVAYAIGRTYHLGSCGDVMTTYSQDTIYWTEYVDTFGRSVSSSPETTRTTVADVPAKFDAIVQASNTIDTSWLLDLEMGRIVSRMSCESLARQQLEDNMIAYFNRRPPVHIGPVPAN